MFLQINDILTGTLLFNCMSSGQETDQDSN